MEASLDRRWSRLNASACGILRRDGKGLIEAGSKLSESRLVDAEGDIYYWSKLDESVMFKCFFDD